MRRRTKIVATVGPACRSKEGLAALIEAGVDVFRLNFSHGTHEDHAEVVAHVRALSKRGKPVGLLMDLQGPKIRLGKFDDGVELEDGAEFVLTTDDVVGSAARASCDYRRLPKELEAGDDVLINDGRVRLEVLETTDTEVRCAVRVGGPISSRKGVNLPGTALSIPALTEKDRKDLAKGLELGVDLIALSFVQRPEDVRECNEIIAAAGKDTPVIAKIEKPQALECLDGILEEAWGVMVARGDLGVEMYPEQVPVAQKRIIRRAAAHNKVVITATQMLESMRESPVPTRAEASDVANAIFDGTDAVMLSGETAIGEYPVESVDMMSRICAEAERALDTDDAPWTEARTPDGSAPFGLSIARSVASIAHEVSAEAVVAFTRSSSTARYISKNRLPLPIVAFTPVPETLPRLCLLRGVLPCAMPEIETVDEMIKEVDATLQLQGLVNKGDEVVIAAGAPVGRRHATNMLLVHRIGDVAD